MCCGCDCMRHGRHYGRGLDYAMPLISVDEEAKELEEYKEALANQIEKVNRRLEALKK